MINISPDFDEEILPWDVALEALMRDECLARKVPLTALDVHRLAEQYVIRFDDLMLTLFELTVQGRWRYLQAPGVAAGITRADMDALWGDGRVELEQVMAAWPGGWRPVG